MLYIVIALLIVVAIGGEGATAQTDSEASYYNSLQESMELIDGNVFWLGLIADDYTAENITETSALSMLGEIHETVSAEHSKFITMTIPVSYTQVNYYWKEALLSLDNSVVILIDSIKYDNPNLVNLSVDYLTTYSYNLDQTNAYLASWQSTDVPDTGASGTDDDNESPGFSTSITILAIFISVILFSVIKKRA